MTPEQNPNTPDGCSPWHPDYGVTDDIRFKAVTIAKQSGVEAAIRETGFHQSTIYKWMKALKNDS